MSEEAKKEEKSEAKPEEKKLKGEGKKVLVVDDDPGSTELFKGILEKEGFEVLVRENGQQGLDLARTERPELIIADVLMPEMDGFNLFKELKKDPQTAKITILISTVRAKMEDSFLAVGADGFIPKPIDTKKLLEIINEFPLPPIPEVSADAGEAAAGEAPAEEAKEEEKKE